MLNFGLCLSLNKLDTSIFFLTQMHLLQLLFYVPLHILIKTFSRLVFRPIVLPIMFTDLLMQVTELALLHRQRQMLSNVLGTPLLSFFIELYLLHIPKALFLPKIHWFCPLRRPAPLQHLTSCPCVTSLTPTTQIEIE